MKASIIKYPMCLIKGHKLDTPSIIDFMDKGNYLKRCSRCGLYRARSVLDRIEVTVTESEALDLKREFDDIFGPSKNQIEELECEEKDK